ncbi:MAG TPA: pseudouridine synthase [Verrucomicrobiales bacterium]|nr:pseudouridine synthase [Verrucomicrobiales bacterium]
MLIALHKPYDVLSQFTPEVAGQRTLAEFGLPPDVYPIGRLDRDSEGLLLLSDEKPLVDRLLNPRHAHPRTYWVQVEGIPDEEALDKLRRGVMFDNRKTLPCRVRMLEIEPVLPPRVPSVRFRKSVPDRWIELELIEGRNRQVRRMTAVAGYPTLRLVRVRVGGYDLNDLPPGKWRELDAAERRRVLSHE